MDTSIKGISSSQVSGHVKRPAAPPDAARVFRDQGAVPAKPHGAREANTPQKADLHADSGPIVPLEKALPVALLKRAEWMRTEWAWRRLLTEVAHQSAQGRTSTLAESLPGQSPVHAPARTSAEVPAKASAQNTVQASAQIPGQASSQAGSAPGQSQPFTVQADGAANAIHTLWSTLANLASAGRPEDRHASSGWIPAEATRDWPVAAQTAGGGLVSFHSLQREHLHKDLPEEVQKWILADRWIGAVHTPDAAMTGAGLWFFPADGRNERLQAVHWRAERHTRTTATGVEVHRLNLVISYEGYPVRIQFISARPEISIHISTNHAALRSRLSQCAQTVESSLATLGWRVNRWTVGEWDGEESQ